MLASWAEIAFAPPRFITGSSEAGESALSALRTFRLFRVFKLARSWSDLRIILETIVKTLEDVSNFAILLGKYSKRRRSNVAVIHVRIVFIGSFLFYCLLLNHSFPTNPNSITNCFETFLFLLQLYKLHLLNAFPLFLIFEQ